MTVLQNKHSISPQIYLILDIFILKSFFLTKQTQADPSKTAPQPNFVVATHQLRNTKIQSNTFWQMLDINTRY